MKKSFKLIAATIFASLSVGVAVGAGVFSANKSVEITEADGTMVLGSRMLISLKQDAWTTANIKTAVYFWGDQTSGWSAHYVEEYPLYDSSNKIRIIDVPAGEWTNFKCVRANPSNAPSTPSGSIWDGSIPNCDWGQTSNQTYGSNNTFEPVIGGGYGYDTAAKLEAGDSLYLDLNGIGWTSDDRLICAHFWGNTDEASATDVQLTNVLGWDNYNENLYEIVIPGTGFWSNVLFYRSSAVTGETWDNQTGDLGGSWNNNVIKLSGWNAGDYNWNFSDSDRANALGIYIKDQLAAQCASYTTNTKASFATPWANIKAQFKSTNSYVQTIFKNVAPATSGDNQCALAASKYDFCVRKYDLENFAVRTISSIGRINPFFGDDVISESNTTIWVIVSSAVALTAIAGFFFLKKKRA